MHRTAILFLAAVAAVAQGPGHIAILRGELSPGVSLSPDYIVELESTAGALPTHREFVSPTGAFQFKDVEQGHYRLIVRNLGGDVVKQEFVNVMDSSPLVIQLPVSKTVSPPAGAISAQHLRAEGHNNLGRRYMTSKEYAKAAEEFQKAANLSGHPKTEPNLGNPPFPQGRLPAADERRGRQEGHEDREAAAGPHASPLRAFYARG